MPKPAPVVVKEKPKIEIQQEPEKKPGFFARLFGKKKKAEETPKTIDMTTGNLQ